jgi:hypothetical protein
VLHVRWSAGHDLHGTTRITDGGTFVVARRMNLPGEQIVDVQEIAGSTYLFVRLPYVSDPALVVTDTAHGPVVHRGQRDNGAIVEVSDAHGRSTTPAPGQRMSLTHSPSRIELRFLETVLAAEVTFTAPVADAADSGTVQLGVDMLADSDAWLVAALAVALSPANGVVSHAALKAAFATWRGIDEPSDGGFDRNVLRPALTSRGMDMPGPRMNKIAYLVDRCRRTAEFSDYILADVARRLDALNQR